MEIDRKNHERTEEVKKEKNDVAVVNECLDTGKETFSQDDCLHLSKQSLPSSEYVKLEIEEIIEEECEEKETEKTEGKVESEEVEEEDTEESNAEQSTLTQRHERMKACTSIEKKQKPEEKGCNLMFTKLAWDRWNDLKKSLSVKTHSDLALLLIDCWFERYGNSGLEQNLPLDVDKADKSVAGEEVKVEINDEASNDSTDVDYDELSDFIKSSREQESNICTDKTKQMESYYLVAGLISDYSKGSLYSNESCTKRKLKKSKASHDPDYDIDDEDGDSEINDEDDVKQSHRKKKKSTQKIRKGTKGKKSRVTSKNCKKKKTVNPEPKKPWIKIQLSEHEEKYQVECMKSFARMNRSNDAVETLYSCLVCNQFKCASKDIFENHIEKHINKVLDCEGCKYIGNSEQDIREHKWTCCKRPKRESVCPLCGHWTASSESRRHHLGKVHGIPSWKCIFCPDMFKTRDERKDHMRTVHEEACQYCDSCKLCKYLLSKEEFKAHLENCSSSVQCQICGLLVKTKSMNKHIQSKHENIRKHQCNRCPYAAKTLRRLKTHLLSHDNIHPFKCNMCPFTCIQSNQLKSHMRTHTGEKPYKCTQCKYAAAWNVQLKDHIKVHSIATAVMCQECDMAFKNERTLNLHTKKEHLKTL